jgi:hypothetical protein
MYALVMLKWFVLGFVNFFNVIVKSWGVLLSGRAINIDEIKHGKNGAKIYMFFCSSLGLMKITEASYK